LLPDFGGPGEALQLSIYEKVFTANLWFTDVSIGRTLIDGAPVFF
jgi:hypothetical protein